MSQLTRAERLSNALARARDKVEHTTRLGTQAGLTVAGGIAAGWIEAKKPTIGSSNFSTVTLVGSALLGAGLLGFAKGYSDELVAAGAGMLAGSAKDEARQYFAQAA